MKKEMVPTIAFLVTLSAACQSLSQDSSYAGGKSNSSPVAQTTPSPTSLDPETLCRRIPEIKILPFKGDKGGDVVYDSLVAAGDAVVPCLIDQVTNVEHMEDPRETPKFPDTRVGDVAYFVLTDITKIDFTDPLPPKVKEEYKVEGVNAYFRFVEKPENRNEIQRFMRDWRKKTH